MLLNESGLFTPDIIKRQIAHAEEDGVRAAYNESIRSREAPYPQVPEFPAVVLVANSTGVGCLW
jgi:hypothetical protein